MSGGVAKAQTEPAQDDEAESDEVRSIAEWVTLIVSVAVLAGMFAIVTYLYVAGDDDPVIIRTEAELNQIRVSQEAFYLPVSVFNDGDATAGDVQIQAELKIGENSETSAFSITTLASNDSETGIVAFSGDPSEGELTVRVVSYIELFDATFVNRRPPSFPLWLESGSLRQLAEDLLHFMLVESTKSLCPQVAAAGERQ